MIGSVGGPVKCQEKDYLNGELSSEDNTSWKTLVLAA